MLSQKAQIILDAAKVSAASGGNSEPKQGQRSQSARGFCPRSTMRVPQPNIIEHFGNAGAVPQPPERCLSRQAGIVRYCLKYIQKSPPAKQLAGLFFGFLGFRLVAHVRYCVHGDERLGVFAVHEVHQLLVLALVHDGDDLAAFFHVVGTVGFIHRGPAVQVG